MDKLHNTIKTQLLLYFILHAAAGSAIPKDSLSPDQMDKWTNDRYDDYTNSFILALRTAGFEIVKKEKSFEELMSQ